MCVSVGVFLLKKVLSIVCDSDGYGNNQEMSENSSMRCALAFIFRVRQKRKERMSEIRSEHWLIFIEEAKSGKRDL